MIREHNLKLLDLKVLFPREPMCNKEPLCPNKQVVAQSPSASGSHWLHEATISNKSPIPHCTAWSRRPMEAWS